MGPPNPEELADIQNTAAVLPCESTIEILEDLLKREYKLVEKCEGDNRLITLHNITGLVSAIVRLKSTLDQIVSPQQENPRG